MKLPCRIELFGGLRVELNGRLITRFQTQKTAVLLAYLAFYPQRSHPREELVDLLWPDDVSDATRHRLRMALSSLRRQLEPPGPLAGALIVATRASVQLNLANFTTDVTEFEAALQAAERAGSNLERTQLLTQAVEFYRGGLLSGYYEEWIDPERSRLAEAYLQGLGRLVGHLEQGGDLHRALDYARRAVAADPLREESHDQLIRLLTAAGQPKAALRQYLELERLLAEELDAEPTARIQEFAQDLKRAAKGRPGQAARKPKDGESGGLESGLPSALQAPGLPTGTVTFLLVWLPGVFELQGHAGPAVTAAREHACELLRPLLRAHRGHELPMVAETLQRTLFGRASDALAAAIAGQRALAEHRWPAELGTPRVRMALHTGEVEPGQEVRQSPALLHATQVLLAAHPGQILLSEKNAALLRSELEEGLQFVDLGLYHLRDRTSAEHLFLLQDAKLTPRELPRPNAQPALIGNLPRQLNRFVGRERQIASLQEQLLSAETRLVSLTGLGGAGKTSLALEVASRIYQPFHGAVWFVPLADITDPQLMGETILSAMYLPRSPEKEPLEQVAAALSDQRTLLILDSFEHLANEGAAMLHTLLEEVETLTVLVTSRQRLCLPGEHEVPVRPLPTPSGPCPPERLLQYESVRLFVDRAQAVRPDFQVTAANAAAVAELCRRLEGLPLALELAAARVGVLTPAQMLDRLGQRFELLVSRGRERVPRHRSLRAALDWSYQLLSPELQWCFVQLSSFRGGWALEAAEAVCADFGFWILDFGLPTDPDPIQNPNAQRASKIQNRVLDHLTQLQECGLVLSRGRGEEMRYHLLETLREYAAEQLTAEQRTELARRHAAYYLGLAERAEPELRGPDQRAWLGRLETEHANLRAALDWAVESGATEWGLRLAGALWPFWGVRGYWSEGRERLGRLLDLREGARREGETREPPERTAAQARALHGAGVLAHLQGDLKAARLSLEESLAIWRERDDPWGIAQTLDSLGWMARDQGRWGAARVLCDEGLALSWKLGDDRGIAFWLHILGDVARARGDEDAARALYQESLSILMQLGDRQGIGVSLDYLGNLALDQGDFEAGRALLEESLTVSRELGDKCGIARSLYHLGKMALNQGGWRAAFSLYAESLAIRRQLGNKQSIADCLEGLGAVYGGQEQPERAARLFGAAEALRDARISSPSPVHGAGGPLRRVEGAPLAGPGKARMTTVEQLITEALEAEAHP